jgi:penicillin-binding protein 1B
MAKRTARQSKRPVKPLPGSTRGKNLKIGAALLSIPAIIVAIFLIRYYYIFNGIIEEKLGKRYSLAETEIYASPTILYPGKRVAPADLVSRVRHLGYIERSPAGISNLPDYEFGKKNQLLIYNDPSLPADPNRLVEVSWNGGVIRSIVDSNRRTELESFALKPELLSNVINKNREKRRYVSYQDLPKVLIDAILASEDRRFFTHRGVDPIRILSALIVDIRHGDKTQGASTLTQQFVKNYFLTPEKTWRRKISDAYMSILLENRFSKEEIFELYCNEVYLGQRGSFSIVGMGEAAEVFFEKSVKDLAAGEAAMLAGIITAPNRFTPLRYPERAKARRDLVLDLMAEYGMISAKDRDQAKSTPLGVKPTSIMNYSDAPYFVDYVQDILVEKFGDLALARSKYRVYTTLVTELQQAAFEALRQGMVDMDAHFSKGKRGIPPGTVQASLIAVEPKTGRVLAMIGGRNYGLSQFNRITQAKRQPGSIFKPFVYATALETAYYSSTPLTAASTVVDEPTQFAFENLVYEPKNFKDEYFGQVTMRQAITKSLNTATIKFAEKVGYKRVADLALRLGLNAQIKPYPAMAIGAFEVTPLEMVRAYTAFANGGLLTDLTPISRVDDSRMNSVFVAQSKSEQVLSPQVAFMVTSLLQSVINNGTGAPARTRGFTLPAAGKTGTSRDGWFAGYTPDLLCIVWVGFDDNRELNLSGSQSALPIWADFMKHAATLMPLRGEDFPMPDGVSQVEIDPATGLLSTPHCLERLQEYFIRGSEPALACMGNSYEQMSGGAPVSIYSTPRKEPESGSDTKNAGSEAKRKPGG